MDKATATTIILSAKKASGLTYQEIGEKLGHNQVWVAAAIMGQATMNEDEATILGDLLDLDEETILSLQDIPLKGSLESTVPADPLIYRFHEVTQVYGTTLKAIIHEMFGDGIMSAIDFTLDVQKKEDPKGDRVVVTFDGKFLPYKKW